MRKFLPARVFIPLCVMVIGILITLAVDVVAQMQPPPGNSFCPFSASRCTVGPYPCQAILTSQYCPPQGGTGAGPQFFYISEDVFNVKQCGSGTGSCENVYIIPCYRNDCYLSAGYVDGQFECSTLLCSTTFTTNTCF